MDLPPKEIACLEIAVEHETSGKLSHGADKVAMVVINRTNDPRFPNTTCAVIYQPHQFTNIRKTRNASPESKQVVADVLQNKKLFDKRILFFHSGPRPRSWKNFTFIYKIGGHRFYEH